jgi:hypothetical protein
MTQYATASVSAEIGAALFGLVQAELDHKDFKSGSKGFYCQQQITVGGQRYQASAQAILLGSKQDPQMQVRATADQAKSEMTELIEGGMPPKDFTTGKTGYYTSGKFAIGSESYQAQAQAVLLAR